MEHKLTREILFVDDMTCTSCERKIENTLKKLDGIVDVKALYVESKVYVTYAADKIDADIIIEQINYAGYKTNGTKKDIKYSAASGEKEENNNGFSKIQYAAVGIIFLSLYVIIKNTIGFNFIPEVDQSMSYGLLFIVGLLTSIHCVAMCGGLNISQCINPGGSSHASAFERFKPSFLYNTGRVISYTVIGGIVGSIGSVVSFSGTAKGIVAVIAGAFMIIMGLNMLNIFPSLRRFTVRFIPKSITNKLFDGQKRSGPLYVGLLNGLMPCGPLQTMQLYALGTGSFAAGALSMFAFSIGTVPLMFGLGAVSTMLSKNFTQKMMKVSAVLVLILGFAMVSRGMSLSGVSTDLISGVKAVAADSAIAEIDGGIQTVSIELKRNKYTPIIVQKGVPVRFIINAEKPNLNGCNNEIYIRKYEKSLKLKPGENIIEFIPSEEGSVPYSCWMGMIRSNILVVTDLDQVRSKDL